MSRLPVLVVIKGLGAGGAERLLVDGLSHADHDRFSYEVAYVVDWKDALVPELTSIDVPVHSLDGERDPRWITRLRTLVWRSRPLIVHSHLPIAGFGTRLAAGRRAGVRHVYTEHNEWSSYRRATLIANAATFWRNDHVFAVSERVRESIRYPFAWAALSLPPVETLYHGVDQSKEIRPAPIRDELGLPSDAPLVVNVANLRRQKGHETLVRAAAEVRPRLPNVHFVLVGAGLMEARIRELISSLDLTGTVHLVGSRVDAANIAAAADVFALASDFEGLPIALLEAMTTGRPCIATDVGGTSELLRHEREGILVPPRSPESLGDAIVALLHDRDLRWRYGAAGATRAKELDISAAMHRVEERYGELVA